MWDGVGREELPGCGLTFFPAVSADVGKSQSDVWSHGGPLVFPPTRTYAFHRSSPEWLSAPTTCGGHVAPRRLFFPGGGMGTGASYTTVLIALSLLTLIF